MNKIYKVIWSKAKNCYVVASELAKSHTKSPKSGVISRAMVVGLLTAFFSFNVYTAVYAAESRHTPKDDERLYNRDTTEGIVFKVDANDNIIGIGVYHEGNGDLYVWDMRNIGGNGGGGATYTAGEGIAISSDNKISAKAGTNVTVNASGISVTGNGSVASGNTGLIDGGKLYSEVRPSANGKYVKTGSTTAANLTALDTQAKKNADAIAAEVTNRTTAVNNEKTARENADTALSNRIGTLSADGSYIKKDNNASQNLKALDDKIGVASVANGTFAKTANTVNANIKALDTAAANAIKGMTASGKKITYTKGDGTTGTVAVNGTGTVSSGNTELINGGTAYTELRPADGNYVKSDISTANNLVALDNALSNRTKFVSINGASTDGNYLGNGATGTNAIAIGNGASATNTNTIAIGTGNVVNGQNSGAIGDPSIINGDNSYSVGNNNNIGEDTDNVFILGNSVNVGSTGEGIVALGNNVTVNTAQESTKARKTAGTSSVSHSFVAGDGAIIGEENSVAVGYQAKSRALNGTALGSGTDVEAEGGTAVGHNATVNDYFGTAVGYEAVSTGEGSSAFGQSANAGAKFATAFGRSTQAQGESSTAIGNNANAVSQGAVAIGLSSVANGGGNTSAVAIGNGATVGTATQGYGNAVAIGGSSNVGATSGTAIGHGASVTAQNSVALGQGSIANVANTVSVGTTSAKRRVVNVSDGTSATDGATVGQTIELVAGDNISITASGTNSVGQKKYTVGLTIGGGLITYDNSDHDTVTLDGTDGTRLTGLADGALLASSTDAVTGAQLYETNQAVAELESALTDTNTAVATNKTNIATLQTNYNTLNSTVNAVKADVDSGFNVNVNGTQVKNVNPGDNNINFKNGTSISLAKDGNSVKVSVNPDGTIASGNGNALSGGTVYTEVRPASNGTYVKTANTTATNLTALDTQVKANADAIAQEVTDRTTAVSNEATARADADTKLGGRIGTQSADGNYIKKSATNSVAENVAVLDTQLKSTNDALNGLDALAVKYDASAKTKVTLEGSGGTTISNVKAGTLSATSTEAVNGSQLYTTNQNLATETTNRTNADTELSNRIGVQAVDGNYIKKSDTNNVVANVAVLDSQLKTTNDNLATEVTNRTNAVNAEKTARESADTGLSNRIGTVSADGSYIKKSDTNNVAQNLTALDTGLKVTADALDALDGLAVQYDATNKTKVTLGGSGGTTIDNVKDGVLSASSKEAVNGSQLYKTNQDLATEVTNRTNAVNNEKTARENADTALSNRIGEVTTDGNYIKKSNTNNVSQNLSVLDTQLKANTDAISNLDGLSVKYDSTVKSKVTLAGAAGTTIDNVKDGLLSATSKEAVNGSQLFATNQNLSAETTARTNADTALSNRIGTQTADGNYIKKSGTNNVVENIAVLDNRLKVTNDNLAQEIQDRADADDALSDRIDELSGNAVHYDGADKKKVTFEGSGGTTLANVKAGTLSATSMEAVNGSQLYQTNQNLAQEVTDRTNAVNAEKTARENADTAILDKIGTLASDGNYIGKDADVSTNLNVLDTELKNTNDALVRETTDRTNADTALSDRIGTISSDGTYVKDSGEKNVSENIGILDTNLARVDSALTQEISDREEADTALSDRIDALSGNAVHYDGATKTKVTLEGNGGTTIDNVKAGTLSANSMEAVNGSQLYTTNQALVQEVADRTTAITNEATARETADTALSDRIDALSGSTVHYDDASKAKITLEGTDGTTIDNVKAGTLSADSMEAVNGSQLYTTNQALAQEVSDRTTAVADEKTAREEADAVLSDRIGSLDGDGNYIEKDKDVLENVSALDTQLKSTDEKLDKEIRDRKGDVTNINNRIDNLTYDMNDGLDGKADANASNVGRNASTDNSELWGNALGTGRVAYGDMRLVTGGTVYDEVRPVSDGTFVKTDNSTGDNLLALDARVAELDGTMGNVVYYDDADRSTVTYGGSRGTVLANVKAGKVNKNSMEAVNGGQLWSVQQDVLGLATDVQRNTKNIRSMNTSISSTLTTIDTTNERLDNMDSLKADASLNNLTDAGKRVLNNYVYDAVQKYMADTGISGADTSNAGTQNTVAPLSAPLSAPMLMASLRTMSVQDDPVQDDPVQDNGNNPGSGMRLMSVNPAPADTNYVVYDGTDASTVTLEGAEGTRITNLADGALLATSTDAVTGAQLYETNQQVASFEADLSENSTNIAKAQADITEIKTKHEALQSEIDTVKTDVDNGFNVTVDDAHVKNVNPNDNLINFVSGDNVKLSDDNGSVKIDVVANGVVEQGNLGLVTGDAVYGATNGKADADLGNLTDAGRDVIREAVSADFDKKADVDANNVDVDKWSEKLGVGEIADGNTGLVNGGTVYNAIKEVQDNALVQTENDTIRIGGNSTASVIDVSKADGEGRVITGIATDPNDASSAANVAYVDAMGQNIINGVNNEFTKVNDRMDKVGAGAAAMAGLVPGSFDDGEKWNFSAAVGNYRSATAGAVGMFYKPTENVTLAVKGAFGNGENMVSGGVGIALSKGNVPGVTKRQLARAVNAQATKIEQLTAEREADRAKIAELERKLERLTSAQKQ